jgi:hypothetical protein
MLQNALSHISGCSTKKAFCAAVARGLGSLMPLDTRQLFYTFVVQLSGFGADVMMLSEHDDPLQALGDEVLDGSVRQALVMTDAVRQNLAFLEPWLRDPQPFLLVSWLDF